MNKSQTLPDSTTPAHWEPKFPFDLVIAYEDRLTRDRAMLLYDRIAQQLMDDYDFQCAWWKLDHLQEPSLMEQAVDDAAQAHMIIVSLHAGSTLPKTAIDWFGAWVPNKHGHRSALVALLNRMPEPGSPGQGRQAHLQRVARQARMDFFIHSVGACGTESHTFHSLEDRACTITPFLENILHTPPPNLMRA